MTQQLKGKVISMSMTKKNALVIVLRRTNWAKQKFLNRLELEIEFRAKKE